jgi:gliding motility-associated-like protein
LLFLGLLLHNTRHMKKYCILFILSFLSFKEIFANHTKGGWMYYEYLGPGSTANTSKYKIVLKIYSECNLTSGQIDPEVPFTFFNAANNTQLLNILVPLSNDISINNCNTKDCQPCINNPPAICYRIRTFELIQDLPNSPSGYIIAYQRCCRIENIINILPPSEEQGETWTVKIPGTLINPGAETNSSAKFSQNDTAIICQNNYFSLDFSATDINNDSLVYSFATAYSGGGPTVGQSSPNPSSPPPFNTLPYAAGYSGLQPLGNQVTINNLTGIVTGIAPGIGVYVVTVVVSEYKRGTNIKIAEVRKSLHVEVQDCSLTKAILNPKPATCDGFTVNFQNDATNTNVQTYYWDFGDNTTSTLETPTHTYAAAGDYTLKLVLNRNLPCSDSAISIVKVYPGFFPDFTSSGQCKNTPIQFRDISTTNYGFIDTWKWNFGDAGSPTNTSTLQNPTHTYAGATSYDVNFIVTSSKGCIDTVLKTIVITDKPALSVTPDTLICIIDTLQLNAVGTGSFLWSPNYNISSLTIPSPLVSPDVTTIYRVTLTDPFGCTGTDSVKVSVVTAVIQSITPADTTICKTDSVLLKLNSNALYYQWTENPAGNTLSNPKIKKPVATPVTNTTYAVTGSIGKCIAQNSITINVVPYPKANAGPDTTICFGKSVQLNASGGRDYAWSPAAFLNNRLIPNPVSQNPTSSIKYVVAVTDVLGCPKPSRDSVFVTVAKIKADAGPSDTSVVLGQPLLLNATGSINYLWDPPRWLSNIGIYNPVSLPQDNITYKVTVSNNYGCFDTDTIRVHLFKLDPSFYVPTAFSPNGDGTNDFFRPKSIGMKSLDIFRVYNRWGQLLFSTTEIEGSGWDGTFRGKGQDPATYVWYAEGTDYLNVKVKKKGYVVLIRQ